MQAQAKDYWNVSLDVARILLSGGVIPPPPKAFKYLANFSSDFSTVAKTTRYAKKDPK